MISARSEIEVQTAGDDVWVTLPGLEDGALSVHRNRCTSPGCATIYWRGRASVGDLKCTFLRQTRDAPALERLTYWATVVDKAEIAPRETDREGIERLGIPTSAHFARFDAATLPGAAKEIDLRDLSSHSVYSVWGVIGEKAQEAGELDFVGVDLPLSLMDDHSFISAAIDLLGRTAKVELDSSNVEAVLAEARVHFGDAVECQSAQGAA